jgi:hypothetical protein
MWMRTNIVRVLVVLAATWAMPGAAVAQKVAVPKPQDKLALGENGSSNCCSSSILTRTARSPSKSG